MVYDFFPYLAVGDVDLQEPCMRRNIKSAGVRGEALGTNVIYFQDKEKMRNNTAKLSKFLSL